MSLPAPQEIIRKKREGQELTAADLGGFFTAYTDGSVADYQMAAMLMAIFLKGMGRQETSNLTKIMRDGGQVLSWDFPREVVVDKHSTGGVGDKTSLILLPLCLLEGLKIPMMAGRGLGHTGGTLDKLEAIPGMNVHPDVATARRLVNTLGGVFMGQTSEIAPIDKRLYALRDVTATIESIPLITASILSKKLAEGLGGLVMDVKFGSGAFMSERADALALARMIADVGRECGLSVTCMLTSMNSPLGTYAGNALELIECVEVMQGAGPTSTRELTLALAVEMVRLAAPKRDAGEIRQALESRLSSGQVFAQFCEVIAAQGGDASLLERPERLASAKIKHAVSLGCAGTVTRIDVRKLGLAVQELGGGRRLVTDKIDPAVGLSHMKRQGDRVAAAEPVAMIHANNDRSLAVAEKLVREAYQVGESAEDDPLISQKLW